MTFPLDLFITPYNAAPKSSLEGARMVGELGDSMQRERLQRMQQSQAEAHFQQTQGLQRQEAQSLDRYRQDQIDARKDSLRDKDQQKREARVAALKVELRKTKPFSPERQMIMQELATLGQSVSEEDTELPEPATPEAAVTPLDIAPSTPAKPMVKTPKTDPKFRAALDAEMSKDATTEDQFGLEGPQDEPKPMPWADLGIPVEAQKEKPKRGGKMVMRDEKGNLSMSYDEPLERQKSREAMAGILGPIVKNARSPEEKRAAQAALDSAVAAVESGGYTTKEAADEAKGVYKDMMGRYKTERRPGSIPTGGGGGMGKEERIRTGALSDDTLNFVVKLSENRGIKDVHKSLATSDRMEALLADAESSPDGFTQHAAMSQYLKDISGAQVSDKERADIFGGAGKEQYWLNEINKYTNSGRLPDGLVRGLREVAQRARQVQLERLHSAEEVAHKWIDTAPSLATSEEKARQKEAASAWFGLGSGDRGSGGAPSTGGKASGRARAEEWLMKNGGK